MSSFQMKRKSMMNPEQFAKNKEMRLINLQCLKQKNKPQRWLKGKRKDKNRP